jgi:divinyl protochlorophyllide a 8-vinyl-reductase
MQSACGIGSMLIEGPLTAQAVTLPESETSPRPALIGPNAVLQLAHAMEQRIGTARTMKVMRKAGLSALPSGLAMIPESDAIAIHHALACCEDDLAVKLVRESAIRTADYIIANRIPAPAVWLLEHLPPALAGRLLMMAIARHAWTFTGAGQFCPRGPWRFTIDRSATGEWAEPPASLFAWYSAVFERLFQRLVAADCRCADLSRSGLAKRVHHYRITRTPPA